MRCNRYLFREQLYSVPRTEMQDATYVPLLTAAQVYCRIDIFGRSTAWLSDCGSGLLLYYSAKVRGGSLEPA